MGWTFGPREKGMSTKDYFAHEFDGAMGEVIASAVVGSVVYLAYRNATKNRVYAIVCLTHRKRGEFGYKDMDEGMGPNASQCPARILALLSPVDEVYSGYALECAQAWRARCQANLRAKLLGPDLYGDTAREQAEGMAYKPTNEDYADEVVFPGSGEGTAQDDMDQRERSALARLPDAYLTPEDLGACFDPDELDLRDDDAAKEA